jgi:hypothetical protein
MDAAVTIAEVLSLLEYRPYLLSDGRGKNFLALNSAFMPNLKPVGTEIALSL